MKYFWFTPVTINRMLFSSEKRFLQPFPFVRQKCKSELSLVFFDFLHHQPPLEASYLCTESGASVSLIIATWYLLETGMRWPRAKLCDRKTVELVNLEQLERAERPCYHRRHRHCRRRHQHRHAPPRERQKPVSRARRPLCVRLFLWGRGDKRGVR